MNEESSSARIPPPRNGAATASLVISFLFLVQCIAFLATIVVGLSSWGIRTMQGNPDHPLAVLSDAAVELNILFFPLDLIAGAVAIMLGIRGILVARRLAGNLGRSVSMIGIGFGLLVLILPFVTFFCWASAFRQ